MSTLFVDRKGQVAVLATHVQDGAKGPPIRVHGSANNGYQVLSCPSNHRYMVVLEKPLGLTLAPDPVTGQVWKGVSEDESSNT